jgi:hypothetical protein
MQAVATVLIKGKCDAGGSVLEAETSILAEITINTWHEVAQV